MTAETLKPFLSLPNGSSKLNSTSNAATTINNVRFYSYCVFIVVLCASISGIEIWNSIRTSELQREVQNLKDSLDQIKKRFGVEFDDLDEFESVYESSEPPPLEMDSIVDMDAAMGGVPLFDSLDDEEYDEGDYIDMETDDEDDDNDDDDGNGSGDLFDNVNDVDANGRKINDTDATIYEDFRKSNLKARRTRSVASQHGVPVIEGSYANRRNRTHSSVDEIVEKVLLHRPTDGPKMMYDWNNKQKRYFAAATKPSESEVDFTAPSIDHSTEIKTGQSGLQIKSRRGRVMKTNKEDKSKAFRQVIKKSDFNKWQAKIGSGTANPGKEKIRVLRHMQKSMEKRTNHAARGSRSIAVHYSGDTSRYNVNIHEHFQGNGRLRHTGGVYVDWLASPWVNSLGMDRFFLMSNGIVTVKESGIYQVYAQIFYHDAHDSNSYRIEINGVPFLQCVTMNPSAGIVKSNTCYTAGTTHLKNGDQIYITDLGNQRYTLLADSQSFFGLIRLSDGRPAGSQPHPQHQFETLA